MSALRLVIGNYNTSSRSLAVWLVLRRAGIAFDLEALDLRDPLGLERARQLSPRGRLPVLEIGETTIWEPLAICEYVAEQSTGLWPEAADQRARARAIAAEAVYELADLPTFLPMDMTARFSPPGKLLRSVQRDLDRLQELWAECLAREPEGGPFLFGRFSAADAFMAPLVARLVTHGIELGGRAEKYMEAVRELPEYVEWAEMAEAETAGAAVPTPGRAPLRRPGSAAAPRPASPPKRRPAAISAEDAPSPSRPVPVTGGRRLFARPATTATGEVAKPAEEKMSAKVAPVVPRAQMPARSPAGAQSEPEPAEPAAETQEHTARIEPTAPPTSSRPAPQSETGTAASAVPPGSPPAAPEPETPPRPARRPRRAPSGPIVKSIGGGIRRRR